MNVCLVGGLVEIGCRWILAFSRTIKTIFAGINIGRIVRVIRRPNPIFGGEPENDTPARSLQDAESELAFRIFDIDKEIGPIDIGQAVFAPDSVSRIIAKSRLKQNIVPIRLPFLGLDEERHDQKA